MLTKLTGLLRVGQPGFYLGVKSWLIIYNDPAATSYDWTISIIFFKYEYLSGQESVTPWHQECLIKVELGRGGWVHSLLGGRGPLDINIDQLAGCNVLTNYNN